MEKGLEAPWRIVCSSLDINVIPHRLHTRFEVDVDRDFDGDGNRVQLVDGGMTSNQRAPIGQMGQRAAWSSRINRLSDRDAHYFDFLIDVPALAGNQNANYLLGVLAYEQAEFRIFPARYELVIGGTPVGTHNVASTAGRHNRSVLLRGFTGASPRSEPLRGLKGLALRRSFRRLVGWRAYLQQRGPLDAKPAAPCHDAEAGSHRGPQLGGRGLLARNSACIQRKRQRRH
ncbi:MAG: hypothetical protein DCC64_15775 [Planctomycetota bacterium]|nr:MAG: hypothetical protein DCC64_15775 [Planctomycetota bacterium]